MWTKEVKMVDSVDFFLSSRSIQGQGFTHVLIFEILDARIASTLNKIIQNSYFKKKVSLEEQKAQKDDRFLLGRQTAYMICKYFPVTGAHQTVLDFPIFSVLLYMATIFMFLTPDGIKCYNQHVRFLVESLCKMLERESDQHQSV